MASSRLPGKVLLDIAGQPMLARVVERARRAKTVHEVVVATTTAIDDQAVAAFCQARRYAFIRGSLHDVLDRYYQAAQRFQAGVIVRVTADCPLIDPGLIDATVEALDGWDFAANRLPPPLSRTFPIGLDVEVCTFAALERAWWEASQAYQREHVMPYLYENEPVVDAGSGQVIAPGADPNQQRGFGVRLLNHHPDYGALRWTVDTAPDLELARQVYARFDGRDDFSWEEVLALFRREPELAHINAEIHHKGFLDVDTRG